MLKLMMQISTQGCMCSKLDLPRAVVREPLEELPMLRLR
jgi:hypothetical protein